jgi:hypothetical protein
MRVAPADVEAVALSMIQALALQLFSSDGMRRLPPSSYMRRSISLEKRELKHSS